MQRNSSSNLYSVSGHTHVRCVLARSISYRDECLLKIVVYFSTWFSFYWWFLASLCFIYKSCIISVSYSLMLASFSLHDAFVSHYMCISAYILVILKISEWHSISISPASLSLGWMSGRGPASLPRSGTPAHIHVALRLAAGPGECPCNHMIPRLAVSTTGWVSVQWIFASHGHFIHS